ncbi:DUF2599 domain-containing protein [Pseudomonas sp.]
MCLFPFDGFTSNTNRGMNGCDAITAEMANQAGLPFVYVPPRKPTSNGNNFGSCGKLLITTAQQWLAFFKQRGEALWDQCSWDIEDQDGWNAALTVHQSPIDPPYPEGVEASWYTTGHMELLKRTGTTDAGTLAHIDAFYYDPNSPGSLDAAKNFQRKLKASGYSAPILQLNFSAAPENRFIYSAGDQSEAFTNLCPAGYIEKGEWVFRYDPGTQHNEWTLMVTPTPCGRDIRENGTNQEYLELWNKFSGDEQWKNNDQGGMRRQLVCHLVIARYKSTWNLEPFRPDVSHEQSIKDGCNSVVAQ